MADELHPGLPRILEDHGADLLDTLAALPAPDLTTLLLAVAEQRAAGRTPSQILAQYERDRFVTPTVTPGPDLRDVADTALRSAESFDEVTPSPLAPLGLHSVLGGISQNRLVSTIRTTEVAADPTNALALEAAVRRRASEREVRLKAVQRVTRAQVVDGPLSFAHFTLFGLVTAGRDAGNHEFEINAMASHINHHVALARELGMAACRVSLSDLSGQRHALDRLLEIGAASNDVETVEWADREAGTGYYPALCFKLHVTNADGDEIEVADGGTTEWTQLLLQNRKERLMISGAGLDRLAASRVGLRS